jgi:hypothetical protein
MWVRDKLARQLEFIDVITYLSVGYLPNDKAYFSKCD